ncbi:MAG: hypothetical protein HY918_02745 [Candidatus Doudnabacteria bacterium]|nr:hypothetical protein [Candidatus Doudnabacteria bacterium]
MFGPNKEIEMTSRITRIAEFQLVRVGSFVNEPTETTDMLLLGYQGKVLAVRKGQDTLGIVLGKFYNRTPEGMFLLNHIRGRFRLEQLDAAVIMYGRQRGTANSMSGHSTWITVLLKDGKLEKFCDL